MSMTDITLDLVRKKSEHHDGLLEELEEISLHQLGIRRISGIQHWCRRLKILYLQGNLIERIEGLGKLKCLTYLNLAMNNIERIEGLEGCESLQKLDLTGNFIGEEYSSIYRLKENTLLQELFLVGNPCWSFPSFRHFVIDSLPTLKEFDGKPVLRAERIEGRMVHSTFDSLYKDWWKTEGCKFQEKWGPAKRLACHETMTDMRQGRTSGRTLDSSCESTAVGRKLFCSQDGRPLNVNEGKWEYKLDDQKDSLVLTVFLPKHLDVSVMNVDVQPTFIRVTVRGKILQLVFLFDEVSPDRSNVMRVTSTGHLVVTMPKVAKEFGMPSLRDLGSK